MSREQPVEPAPDIEGQVSKLLALADEYAKEVLEANAFEDGFNARNTLSQAIAVALYGAIEVLVPRPEPSMSMFANKQDYETARAGTGVQPPAGIEQSRSDFEAFIAWSRAGKGIARTMQRLERDGHGYADESTQRHWWTWQHARTALLAGGFSLDRLGSEVLNESPPAGRRTASADARSDEKKEGQEGLQGPAIEDRARQLRKFVEQVQAGKWKGAEARRVATMVLAYVDHGTGVEPDAAIRELT